MKGVKLNICTYFCFDFSLVLYEIKERESYVWLNYGYTQVRGHIHSKSKKGNIRRWSDASNSVCLIVAKKNEAMIIENIKDDIEEIIEKEIIKKVNNYRKRVDNHSSNY